MAGPQISIRIKLTAVSTVLLILAIGIFCIVESMQSRRIIKDFSRLLHDGVVQGARESGAGQVRLLAEAARAALSRGDCSMLRATVGGIGRQKLVSFVAVVDAGGIVVAHGEPSRVGRPASGMGRDRATGEQVQVLGEVSVRGRKSMGFRTAVNIDGRYAASVYLAQGLEQLHGRLSTVDRDEGRAKRVSLTGTLVVGLATVMLGIGLTVVLGTGLFRPIRALCRQADRMAEGDLEARVEVDSGDEIGFLGERFNFMADQMLLLMHETLVKATMEKELEVASAIQGTLVPDAAVAELEGMMIAGFFRAATHCGGDWWSYHQLPDGRTLVLVGDVTGHGVGAAMITAAAQGAVTTVLESCGDSVEVGGVMKAMNNAIYTAARGQFVMTCFASIYDPRTTMLSFANAGHVFPYYFDAAGQNLVGLVIRGNRLGELARCNYEVSALSARPGDGLFWYTDGIVKCEDAHGEAFGEPRLREAVHSHAHLPPDQALESVVVRAIEFYGEVPQKDDITLVVGKFV